MAPDLEKRFSLEFLPSGVNVPASALSASQGIQALGEDALKEAVSAYVGPILNTIAGGPNIRVFDLFDMISARFPSLKLDMPTFQFVVQWMTKNGLVKVVIPDRHGNDLITFAKS